MRINSRVYWHQMWKRLCETGLGLRGRYKSAFYLQYCFFVDNSNDPSISNYWFGSRMIRRIRQIEKGVIVFDLLCFPLQQNMPTSIYVPIYTNYIQFPCLVKVKKNHCKNRVQTILLNVGSIFIALLLCSLRLWRDVHSDEEWITVLESKLIEIY